MMTFRGITFILALASLSAYSFAEECTLLLGDSVCIPETSCVEESYFCETEEGQFLDLSLTDPQMEQLGVMIANGQAASGSSILSYNNSEVDASSGVLTLATIELQGPPSSRRKLAQTTGDAYVLVVKVIDVNGKKLSDSTQEMSDNWFGPSDPVHLKSQMNDCSGGQFNVIPGYNPSTLSQSAANNFDAASTAPGVIEVNIPLDITGNIHRMMIAAATLSGLANILGIPVYTLSGAFDHIAIVIEKCYYDCDWGAWGIVNHHLSMYQDWYYLSARTQMHSTLR